MLAINKLICRTLYSCTLCDRKGSRSSSRYIIGDERYAMRDNEIIARCVGRRTTHSNRFRIPTDKGVCVVGNRTGHIRCSTIIYRLFIVCHHLHIVRTHTINIGESNRVLYTTLREVSSINSIFTYNRQFCLSIYMVIRSVFPTVKTIGILRSRRFRLCLSGIYRLYAILYIRLLQNDAAILILKGNLVGIIHNLVVITLCLLRLVSQCHHLLRRSKSCQFRIGIIEASVQVDSCATGIRNRLGRRFELTPIDIDSRCSGCLNSIASSSKSICRKFTTVDSKRLSSRYIECICDSRSGSCSINHYIMLIRHSSITQHTHTIRLGLCLCINGTSGNGNRSTIVIQTISKVDIRDTFHRTTTHIACIAGRNQHTTCIVGSGTGSMSVLCTDMTSFYIQRTLCDINSNKLTSCSIFSSYLTTSLRVANREGLTCCIQIKQFICSTAQGMTIQIKGERLAYSL